MQTREALRTRRGRIGEAQAEALFGAVYAALWTVHVHSDEALALADGYFALVLRYQRAGMTIQYERADAIYAAHGYQQTYNC